MARAGAFFGEQGVVGYKRIVAVVALGVWTVACGKVSNSEGSDGCTPDCEGKVCGPDGCEGTCGPGCAAGESCLLTTGQCSSEDPGTCVPNCEGKECGTDGCGGFCTPGCSAPKACDVLKGVCVTDDPGTGGSGGTGPIEQDCTQCNGVGTDLEAMRCAIDLCSDQVYLSGSYQSPTQSTTAGTYAAVAHFGSAGNDLGPRLNGSYALMASGLAVGTDHSTSMGGGSQPDPFSSDGYQTRNVMEWRLHMRAPANAHGFRVSYVFFSAEYDEFIGTSFNDKFYILIEAQSTNSGQQSVINFTACRDPATYYDFECTAPMTNCNAGEKYCYVAINTALSECCWYGGCPGGPATTDISGTGFTCASQQSNDSAHTGSSTGWLATEWTIEPNEEFDIIFHIHDTSDQVLDSEVILDRFLFLHEADPGTKPDI